MTPISNFSLQSGARQAEPVLERASDKHIHHGQRCEGDAAVATRIGSPHHNEAAYAGIGLSRQHFKRDQAAQTVCDQVDNGTGGLIDEAG